MKHLIVQGYNCYIGKNALENWSLLERALPNNIIFHLSSLPSCYVILDLQRSTEKEEIDNIVIKECAEICKNNTKYRNVPNVSIDYTLVSNVKKGKNVGEFYYKNYHKVNKIKI